MAKSLKSWQKSPVSMTVKYYREIKPVVSQIRAIYNEIEEEINNLLSHRYIEVPTDQRYSQDASLTDLIQSIFKKFREKYFKQDYNKNQDPKTVKFRTAVENRVEKAAKAISVFHKTKFGANAKSIAGEEKLRGEPWLREYLRDWTTQNVSLIKDIPLETINDLEQLVTQSVLRGDSRKYLQDQIRNKIKSADTRAKLIARDQTNKLYGTLTELRANNNGWDFYEWSTANDSRVRSMSNSGGYSDHKRLEGRIFKFSEPPVTVFKGKRAGERNNPGQDIQCFPPGTLINVKEGVKTIEDVRIGDLVCSHKGVNKVVELHKNNYSGKLIVVKFFNKTIRLTPNHKLFIKNRGWIRADQLKIGDQPIEFKELFSGSVFSKKSARNIEHPHPEIINNIMSFCVDSRHTRYNLNNGIKTIKSKISDIINSIYFVWLFKLPLWRIFNTKNIKPRGTKNLSFRNDSIFSISIFDSIFSWYSKFSSLRIFNPLSFYSFASSSDWNVIYTEKFFNSSIIKTNRSMDVSIRPILIDIFINKPFLKISTGSFFPSFKMSEKLKIIGTFFRATKSSTIINSILWSFKRFFANKAFSIYDFLHNFLMFKINDIHHYEVVELDSQEYNGKIYNLGVDDSMSYFADEILVANCRCIPIIIFDQKLIGDLKKQSDGSYLRR